MLTEAKYIAKTRDGDRVRLRSKWALFDRRRLIAEYNLIDLLQREAGNLDRRWGENEFLEFDLELGEIPLPFFD